MNRLLLNLTAWAGIIALDLLIGLWMNGNLHEWGCWW